MFVTAGRYVWALSKRNGRRIWRRPIRGDRPNLASLGYGSRRLFLSQGDCMIRTGLSAGSGGTACQRMRPERALRADTREPLDEPFT